MIRVMDKIRRVMKLKKIPHKSTISREIRRIPEWWLRIVLREIVKMVGIPSKFAVDSTGIQISYRSYYYTQRIGEIGKLREGLKLHAAVDIDTRIITNAIVTKWHVNDSPYLIPLLEKEKKIEEVYADKGYDSLRNIRFVIERKGTPYIAIRENARHGLRRRLLKLSKSPEWKKKYSQEGGFAPFLNPRCVLWWGITSSPARFLLPPNSFFLRCLLMTSIFSCTLIFISLFPCFPRNSTHPLMPPHLNHLCHTSLPRTYVATIFLSSPKNIRLLRISSALISSIFSTFSTVKSADLPDVSVPVTFSIPRTFAPPRVR